MIISYKSSIVSVGEIKDRAVTLEEKIFSYQVYLTSIIWLFIREIVLIAVVIYEIPLLEESSLTQPATVKLEINHIARALRELHQKGIHL